MFRVEFANWFSYDFSLLDRTGAPVARADLSTWRGTASIEAGRPR